MTRQFSGLGAFAEIDPGQFSTPIQLVNDSGTKIDAMAWFRLKKVPQIFQEHEYLGKEGDAEFVIRWTDSVKDVSLSWAIESDGTDYQIKSVSPGKWPPKSYLVIGVSYS